MANGMYFVELADISGVKEIKKLKNHPSAEDLYEILKLKDPSIGICTVYRNLEKFVISSLLS
jgi:Fe2+ or Zn2+ uptake regulation protein